jgi:cellulose synthase/poly-beta-1,6-N-acetylglucosamine synthase-like glycosyltransferase
MRTSKQGPVSYVPSGCLLIGRELFAEVGGFDETIETSEDCEFCQRVSAAGLPVVAVPELSVVHLGTPQTLSVFFGKQRWHGRSVHTVFLRNKLRSSGLNSTLFSFCALGCLVAAFASLALAVFSGNWAAFAVAASLLPLASFLLALRRKRWSLLAPLTLLYLAYGVARALCLAGLGTPRRPRPGTWGSLESCAPVGNRHWRVDNPPQAVSLPHEQEE